MGVGRRADRRQLQSPTLAATVPQRHSPAREPEIGGVVVDGFEADRLRRSDGRAVHDPVQVGKVECGSCPELYLTLEHAGRW